MLSWGQEWLEEGSWTGLHRLVGVWLWRRATRTVCMGAPLRKGSEAKGLWHVTGAVRTPAGISPSLWWTEEPCKLNCVSHCFPVPSPRAPWAETEGSISSPFTINAARCRNGVACMDWSWACGTSLGSFLSWWQCYMWLSSPSYTSAE